MRHTSLAICVIQAPILGEVAVQVRHERRGRRRAARQANNASDVSESSKCRVVHGDIGA